MSHKMNRHPVEEVHWLVTAVSGPECQPLEGDITADVVIVGGGLTGCRYALFHRTGGHVQPLSLTRGYALAAHARGAKLFCGNRVSGLESAGNKWKVSTSTGSVTAEQVVLTTNAYTGDAPFRGLHTVFPRLHGIGLERTWAGRIAVTPDMRPHLHELAPGVTAALVFSGRGIAMT